MACWRTEAAISGELFTAFIAFIIIIIIIIIITTTTTTAATYYGRFLSEIKLD